MRGDGRKLVLRIKMRDGCNMWRTCGEGGDFRSLDDHEGMCRALKLDPISTRFEMPRRSSAMGRYDGWILRNGEPVGQFVVAYEGEKLADDLGERLR